MKPPTAGALTLDASSAAWFDGEVDELVGHAACLSSGLQELLVEVADDINA
jgi:hypothetical protein